MRYLKTYENLINEPQILINEPQIGDYIYIYSNVFYYNPGKIVDIVDNYNTCKCKKI